MKGFINKALEPVIEIGVVVGKRTNAVKAIIDTGFNGFISIPHTVIDKTSWQFIGYEAYELASGEIVRDKVYLGYILFDGKKMLTYILSNHSKDVLIGTKLLIGKILTINFPKKELSIKNG